MKTKVFFSLLIGSVALSFSQIRITPALIYQTIAEKGYQTQEVVTRLANYYYSTQIYPRAFTWYEKLTTTTGYMPSPIDLYHYSQTLQNMGEDKEAKHLLAQFLPASQRMFAELLPSAPKIANPNNYSQKEFIGMVIDASDGSIISDAQIILCDEGMQTLLTDTTDEIGFFVLSNKSSGTAFDNGYLQVIKPNYEVFTLPLIFATPGEMQEFIQLLPLSVTVNQDDNLASVFEIDNIHFDYGRINIRYDASVQLAKIVTFLEEHPNVRLDIKVHTDSRGDDDYNMSLSNTQAKVIEQWLIDKGISRERLTAKGYGETQPVNGCENGVPCTEEQHQANKRVEFIVK